MSDTGHGSVGTREQQFTQLLPLRKKRYLTERLYALAQAMKSEPDHVHDGPDPEENLWVPAGYTYFGQFVDHDLTFDNTSSLNPADTGIEGRQPSNLRTPRFDLDSLYGDGPDAMPYMYDTDGASLLLKDGPTNRTGETGSGSFAEQADRDLLRSPNGRAIIGDKRNDENVIVSQIQLLFVRYHNAVVATLAAADPALTGTALFEQARNEVRWTYQTLVLADFLPRIVRHEVWKNLQEAESPDERDSRYALYTKDKRGNLPREFVVAAYRYGHSGVRQGYRMNGPALPNFAPPKGTILNIFRGTGPDEAPDEITLLGFKPLPAALRIQFARFFPDTPPTPPVDDPHHPRVAGEGTDDNFPPLQFAYKLDTNIVDPLGALPLNILPTSAAKGGLLQEVADTIAPRVLPSTGPPPPDRPSLALLNLLRGDTYGVQSGQEVARVLRSKGLHQAHTLTHNQLSIRVNVKKSPDDPNIYVFTPIGEIAPGLEHDTPLWLYILAEAQAPIVDHFGIHNNPPIKEDILLNGVGARTQLGWVGGRIVAEVFYGLLDADDESVVNAAPTGWKPLLGGNGLPVFMNLVKFVDQQAPVTQAQAVPAPDAPGQEEPVGSGA